MLNQGSVQVEGHPYRLVQFSNLLSVTGAHEPYQTLTRKGENIVAVCDTRHGQSLPAAEGHFGRKPAGRSSNEHDDDAADAVDDSIRGENHDGPVTDWRGNSAHQTSPRFTPRRPSNPGYPAIRSRVHSAPRLLGQGLDR